MKPVMRYVIIILFAPLLCLYNESKPAPKENPKFDELRAELKKSLLKYGIPGGIIAVFENGTQTIIEEGYSNIETLTPIKAHMKFRIASNTKTFTALTILLLIDEGRLNLTDKLTDHLPFCGVPYADSVTIEQLLNHTSGIGNYNGSSKFINTWFSDPLKAWTKEEILDIIRNMAPDFLPGEPGKWKYSDSNYFLLGLIVEKITGSLAETEITNRLINALNLQNTSFPLTPDMPDGYCPGYKYNNEQGCLEESSRITPTGPWTGGAIVSNVYDLGKWAKIIGTGKLLSDSLRSKYFSFTPSFLETPLSYGLGIMQVMGLRGHTGMIQGYESCMLYSPEKDVSIVVWVNRCNEDQRFQPAPFLCVKAFKKLYPELFIK